MLLCLKEGKLVYPILGVAGRLAKLCARFETRQEHATFSLYLNRTATLSRMELCTKWKCHGTDLADLSRCSFRDLRVAHFLSGKSPANAGRISTVSSVVLQTNSPAISAKHIVVEASLIRLVSRHSPNSSHSDSTTQQPSISERCPLPRFGMYVTGARVVANNDIKNTMARRRPHCRRC